LLYLLFLVAGAALIAGVKKGDETIFFSSLHTGIADVCFKWITRMAEAPMLALIIILALRFGYGKGLLVALNNLLVFAFVLLFKEVIFAHAPRPAAFFEGKQQLNFVQGVEIWRDNSFPSGHTAAAFALFFMLSIITPNKKWSVLFFALALLVGISRIYLLEHFLTDVYFGSVLGVGITAAFYLIFGESNFYRNLKWKDKALLQ
jgi:membrane-associated phospholipid phosphatase